MNAIPGAARIFAGLLAFGLLGAGPAAGQTHQAGQVDAATDRYADHGDCSVHEDRLRERLRRLTDPVVGTAVASGALRTRLQEASTLPELATYLGCLAR